MITERYLIIYGIRCPVLADFFDRINLAEDYQLIREARERGETFTRPPRDPNFNPFLKVCLNPINGDTFVGVEGENEKEPDSKDYVSIRYNPDDVYVRTINSLYRNRIVKKEVKTPKVSKLAKIAEFPTITTHDELVKYLEANK